MERRHVGSSRHSTDGYHITPNGLLTTLVSHIMHSIVAYFYGAPAPEYALDEVLHPASDMYSLGCLMYAVHCKGSAPFKNHGSLGSVRENAGKPLTRMERLDPDLRGTATLYGSAIEF